MGDKAVSKMTTLNLSAPPRPTSQHGPNQEQWDEMRSLFPIYLALAKQLTIAVPISQDKRNLT